MEAGRALVLLNLENLYESLYDALNQVSLDAKVYFVNCFVSMLLLLMKYKKLD
jgi:hypothetical protein